MSVLVLIPSPFNTQVKILNIIIPQAKARNLCGQSNPSKAVTPCLVASKNNQLIGSPKRIKTHSYLRKEAQTNWPFNCNQTIVCAKKKSSIVIRIYLFILSMINNIKQVIKLFMCKTLYEE